MGGAWMCVCVCATATPNTCHCISSHHLLHGNSISYIKCMKMMYYRTFHKTFLSLFDGILFTFNHFHAIYFVLPWRKFRLSVATAVIDSHTVIYFLFVSYFFLAFLRFYLICKTWCKLQMRWMMPENFKFERFSAGNISKELSTSLLMESWKRKLRIQDIICLRCGILT